MTPSSPQSFSIPSHSACHMLMLYRYVEMQVNAISFHQTLHYARKHKMLMKRLPLSNHVVITNPTSISSYSTGASK